VAKSHLAITKDFQDVFNTEAGERVLRYMKDNFHMSANIYIPGDDQATTAYRDGQRSVLLDIMSKLAQDVDVMKLIEETKLHAKEYELPDTGD